MRKAPQRRRSARNQTGQRSLIPSVSTTEDVFNNMEAFERLFRHLPEHRVAICREASIAIPPAQFFTHLRSHHPSLPVDTRRDIIVYVKSLPDIAWKPEDVILPKSTDNPIDGLPVQRDLRTCVCSYTCKTIQGVQKHARDVHGWKNTRKRGGDVRRKSKLGNNQIWRDGQAGQQLFKAAGWPIYFAVQADAMVEEEVVTNIGRIELQERRKEALEAAQRKGIQDGSRFHANAWVKFTAWPTHLRDFCELELLQLTRPANGEKEKHEVEVETEEERGLGDTCNAMRRLIRKAFRSSQPSVVGRAALEFINRRETGAKSNEMPFYAEQKVRTIRRYTQRVLVILRYMWRTHAKGRRPPYKLTHTQQRYMELLQEAARSENVAERKRLEEYCLGFWIALLDHLLPADEFESGLLSGLAILGIKPDEKGGIWASANEYSQVLSAVITTSRALVIYHAKLTSENGDAPTTFELVQDMVRRFLRLTEFDGMPTPFNRMLRMRTYAYAKAKETMTTGRVSWDGDRILIDKQSFTLADLQSMAKGLHETVRVQLLKDILLLDVDEMGAVRPGSVPLPELNLAKLMDQPAEMAKGWSFLKHPGNKLDSWIDWLYVRVLTEPTLRERFASGVDRSAQPPRIRWRDRAVADYMRAVRQFKERLFVLVHITGGAPARGSEILSIQHENGGEGIGYRGIFAEGGMVSFTTNYHKGYSFSNRVKTIHRYVPDEVGEIVVYYLGLGLPFIDDLQMVWKGSDHRTAFVWEPEAEEEWDEDEEDEHSEDKGDDTDNSNDSDDEENDVRHTVKERKPANPDGFWGTDRTRRVMRDQTTHFLGAALSTSTWRHAYPAIHRELARDGRVTDTLDMVYYNRSTVPQDDARARQAGHSRQTEEVVYGRALVESPFQTMAEREEFRRVSLDWHRVLGFASAMKDNRLHLTVRSQMLAEREQQKLRRWALLADADINLQLRQLVGRADAQFRDVQERAIKSILKRQLRILVIMPTGAGKSMLFMLPAAIAPDGGVTIVVVPLTSLRADLKSRCDRLGIRCAEWDGKRPPYWATIVLVTPESAITKAFGRFLDEKRTLGQLDRIVIDECHVLSESTPDWRPQFLKLTDMTQKGTQVIYLTATLPPTHQPAFLSVAGLDERDIKIFRDRTTRVNISYQVRGYARDQLDRVVEELVKAKQKQYPSTSQIVIYCRSVKETKRLASLLHCMAFYREVGTEEAKARMIHRFTSGHERLVTATNALGLGLDAPNVRVVVHTGMCRLLHQYIQESGRSGRSGLQSEAIVLQAYRQRSDGGALKECSPHLEPPAKDLMIELRCRRIPIDKEMDGEDKRQGCEVGEEKCDLCQQRSRGTKRSIASAEKTAEQEQVSREEKLAQEKELEMYDRMAAIAVQQRQLEIGRRRRQETARFELERLQDQFERWSVACVICMAQEGEAREHSWEQCTVIGEWQRQLMKRKIEWMEGQVLFEAFSRCNFCWAPQAVCNLWEEKANVYNAFRRRVGGTCQFDKTLKHAVSAILVFRAEVCRPWLAGEQSKRGLIHGSADVRLAAWLGKKVKLGRYEMSEMCRFFYVWETGFC